MERVELFAGNIPEPRGSFPSIHKYCPVTFDTLGGEEIEPLEFTAVTTIAYVVPVVKLLNVAFLLATPWSSEGVADEPLSVYV